MRRTRPALLLCLPLTIVIDGCSRSPVRVSDSPGTAPPPAGPPATASRPPADSTGPSPVDAPAEPACGTARWICNMDNERCLRVDDETLGLPSARGRWECQAIPDRAPDSDTWTCGGPVKWVCHGRLSNDDDFAPAEAACGWRCRPVLTWRTEGRWFRCEKPDEEGVDRPPNTWPWPGCSCAKPAPQCSRCEKGTEVGGTVCRMDGPWPGPPLTHAPSPGGCTPGNAYWCEEMMSGTWGTVTCLPDGSWPIRMLDGKKILDCTHDGRRPDTLCACYHPYFDASCCERSDCRIPAADQAAPGQICPEPAGGPCDYCTPWSADKCAAGGNTCVTSNTGEAFCATPCGPQQQCPPTTACVAVKTKQGSSQQLCVPLDVACYL